jgi:hypothetical protein
VLINNTLQLVHIDYARSDVLKAAALQIPVFWDVTKDRIVLIWEFSEHADFIFRANVDGKFLQNIETFIRTHCVTPQRATAFLCISYIRCFIQYRKVLLIEHINTL